MKVTLEYVAMFKAPVRSGTELDISEGWTIIDLLEHLEVEEDHMHCVSAFVNERKAPHAQTLYEGDHVFLAVPTSGG